jgi:hypothetical protein
VWVSAARRFRVAMTTVTRAVIGASMSSASSRGSCTAGRDYTGTVPGSGPRYPAGRGSWKLEAPVGAGRHLLAVGATVLVVGTLFGLRAVRGLDCQETDDGGRVRCWWSSFRPATGPSARSMPSPS